jgi:hypothetical protein
VVERVMLSVLAVREEALRDPDAAMREHVRYTTDLLVRRSTVIADRAPMDAAPWWACPTGWPKVPCTGSAATASPGVVRVFSSDLRRVVPSTGSPAGITGSSPARYSGRPDRRNPPSPGVGAVTAAGRGTQRPR